MIPAGASSGFLRLGGNVPGKHVPEDKFVPFDQNRDLPRASPDAPADMEVGPARMSQDNAKQMGFTGDSCDHCGSMRVKNTGHCNTCEECGTTTGCS